ncbi:MAG: catalase [Candidatus Obscuribacterales bacterium]|nr:catalase [Candidatus Obscuribacterales bacterium]
MATIALLTFVIRRISGAGQGVSSTPRCPFRIFGKSKPADKNQGSEPGLGWKEQFIGGSAESETSFIQTAVSDIHNVQKGNRKKANANVYKRAFHAKILAGIGNAEFVVGNDIPEALRVGILQPGRSYQTAVRFSNASGVTQADTKKDLRGIALRLATDDGSHDFLATNGKASHARDSRQFIKFALALAGSKLLLLPRLLWHIGLFESIRMFATVIKQVSKPVESLATETYFSRSAYAFGDRAVRFQITPASCPEHTEARTDEYLSQDLLYRLLKGPVVFDIQVQLYVNEEQTPIEDGSVEWQGPLYTVAQLIIPQQDLSSLEALACKELVEKLEFNPWNVSKGFRPLGSLNRARNPVYRASQALRTGRDDFFSQKGTTMNSEKNQGGCPFGFGSGSDKSGDNPAGSGGLWRPKSSRQGIGPFKYVYWNMFYWVMETLNRVLSRNPYRKVSWDKWPPFLGQLYLLAKLRYNRSNAITDPYDYAANDTKPLSPEPETAKHYISADGSWTIDNDNPQMGTPHTRFGSNIPPKKIRPDVENMTPSAREAGKLRWRMLDENGKEIVKPAGILNDLAGGWIQFQFHNFGGNTMRDPVTQCPHLMARHPNENWPGNVAVIDRTSKDPTRVTDNGRPTPINEKTVAWIQGQIYGSNEGELSGLRSFEGGKMTVQEDLRLPEDPQKAGIDKTGFNNNYNPLLSFLHWLFVQEHNAIAEHYAYFHPDWDDEMLFQMARKVNVAQIARIHTIQWTEDLLQHPALQIGMHVDWYGFVGPRTKMWLMRLSHRYPWIGRLLKPIREMDIIWGMPGSKWEHHDGPFQVPKHFRMVYRLHEMILSEREIVEPGTNRLLERVDLLNFVHSNTRPLVAKYGYETLAWSFVRKSCGALTLHNFPRALTQFENQQDGTLTDLAERDIFRERTDGTGTYNEFRLSVGEPPVTSFLELTGGDAEMARELEIKYEGDVDAVDAGIGILVEPKPAGFALGFCQFYQFVLNAPRRVKSNRHLTEGYTYAEYKEGMDWVEHGGGMLGAMARHLPGIRSQMEGVARAFSPWKETETFPLRQLTTTHEDTANVFKADLRTFILAAITAVTAVGMGAVGWGFALSLLAAIGVIPMALTVQRMLAMRYMQLCWKKCYTDKRGFMFGTLERAEKSIENACKYGSLHALAVMLIAGTLVLAFGASHPLVALLLLAVMASATGVRKWARKFVVDAQVLTVSLRNRMREGQPELGADEFTCDVDYNKRRQFDSDVPACLRPTLHHGSIHGAYRRSENAEARFYTNYGNVDMEEVERAYRCFAPGRDHLTAYDFGRMHEAFAYDMAKAGRGNCVSRFLAKRDATRRTKVLLQYFADMVVEEDKKLVPAISKTMLVEFLNGTAQARLKREHEEGDRDPSPVVIH